MDRGESRICAIGGACASRYRVAPRLKASRDFLHSDRTEARNPMDVASSNDSAPQAGHLARTLARHPRPLGGDTARSVGQSLVSLTSYVLNNRYESPQQLR